MSSEMDLDPRLNAFRPDLADAALRGQVQAERFVPGEPMRIAIPQTPIRNAPSFKAEQISEALYGEDLVCFEANEQGWSWVKMLADSYVGWVQSETLATSGEAPDHRVSVPRALVFQEPDLKSLLVGALPLGAKVDVNQTAAGNGGEFGIVENLGAVPLAHLAPIGSKASDFVDVAHWFLRTPYLWGGKSVLGLDCSGLIQIALDASGVPAPRDSDMQQSGLGSSLTISDPIRNRRRGDLIFWPGHVGVMTDADYLLHANAHHMMVSREPLDTVIDRFQIAELGITEIRRLHYT